MAIGKALIDMSGVSFTSRVFKYDGNPHSIVISGDLPSRVSVAYENNTRTVEEPNADRCAELMLMTAASYDMDRYFCGDIDEYIGNVTERLRTYAKQYVELQNTLNGFSGDQPLPPNVIFERVLRF